MKAISWKHILWAISAASLLVAIGWVYFQPGFEPILAMLGALAAFVGSFFVEGKSGGAERLPAEVTLYDVECGSKGVDLAGQRLRVSAAFGTYFTALLETEQSYVPLSGQIDCPSHKGQEGLPPIQRIFWALQDPKGPRVVIVAAEGGMGKSTLAAKLVRCLYEREAVDMIVGDSAKSKHVDAVSGRILEHSPSYQTISGFYHRLCVQLGVPYENDDQALQDVRRRLASRRAVIVVDNLETVTRGDQLLEVLPKITGRDIRAVVTTRQATGIKAADSQYLLIRLNPLQKRETVLEFLRWHISQHQNTHPNLAALSPDIDNKTRLDWLIQRSGGIPLLLQLLVSDIARTSWSQVQSMPTVFGEELLNYLYESRWQELGTLGPIGLLAREILLWLKLEQFDNRRITSKRLYEWSQEEGQEKQLPDAVKLLHERFLVVNHDPRNGNYAIFPSLSEFLSGQEARP